MLKSVAQKIRDFHTIENMENGAHKQIVWRVINTISSNNTPNSISINQEAKATKSREEKISKWHIHTHTDENQITITARRRWKRADLIPICKLNYHTTNPKSVHMLITWCSACCSPCMQKSAFSWAYPLLYRLFLFPIPIKDQGFFAAILYFTRSQTFSFKSHSHIGAKCTCLIKACSEMGCE